MGGTWETIELVNFSRGQRDRTVPNGLSRGSGSSANGLSTLNPKLRTGDEALGAQPEGIVHDVLARRVVSGTGPLCSLLRNTAALKKHWAKPGGRL
jgi:hypothetical protein